LAAGWSSYEVVEATTIRPARALGLDGGTGTLSPGAPADIAVFAADEGTFDVLDVHGGIRSAPIRLRNTATYVAGRLLPPVVAEPAPPWVPLSAAQRDAEAARLSDTRVAQVPRLSKPD